MRVMHGLSSKVPQEQTHLFMDFAQNVLKLQLVKDNEQPLTNKGLQNLQHEPEKFVKTDNEAKNLDQMQSTPKKEVIVKPQSQV